MLKPRPVPFPTSLVVKNGSKMSIGIDDSGAVVAERNFHPVAVAGAHDLDAGGRPVSRTASWALLRMLRNTCCN